MSAPVNVYSQNAGTSPIQKAVTFSAVPTATTTNYDVGQIGILPSTNSVYVLTSKSSSGGVITANWALVSSGASGSIDTITATNNSGVVSPVAGNVFITGDGNVSATGSGNAIVLDLAGLVDHAILVGDGTDAITNIGPLTNGQLIIGSTGSDPIAASLTSSGGSVTITPGAGTINLEASGGVASIAGDSGSITGSALTIYANHAALNSGSSVSFVNSGAISTLNLSDSNTNTILGVNAGNLTISGSDNVGVGHFTLGDLTSGGNNASLGYNALRFNQNGSANGAICSLAMQSNVNGSFNFAGGFNSLSSCISGNFNTSLGAGSLGISTGSNNLALGNDAGSAYSGAESSNICLLNSGTVGESNRIRLGTQGSGAGQQNQCFIAGIAGSTSANSALASINTSTGQLGSLATVVAASGAAGGAVILNARIGSITFTGPSIAAGASVALTMTNSAITGAGTRLLYSFSGATASSALSVLSYVPSAGQVIWTMTNGTGAATSTANITFDFVVLN